MTCEQVRSRLSWLLDGELDPPEAAAVRAHAEQCGKCGALLAEMKATDEEIRGALEAAKPGPEFARRVVAAAGRKPFSWTRVVIGTAASLFIALALGSFYVNTRSAPPLQVAGPPAPEASAKVAIIAGGAFPHAARSSSPRDLRSSCVLDLCSDRVSRQGRRGV